MMVNFPLLQLALKGEHMFLQDWTQARHKLRLRDGKLLGRGDTWKMLRETNEDCFFRFQSDALTTLLARMGFPSGRSMISFFHMN